MAEPRTEEELRRARRRLARMSALGSVGVALLFFYSFVLGAWLGPAPLHPIEIAAGSAFSLVLGLFMGRPITRRRLDMQAAWVTVLKVNGRRRRVAFFEDHAALGSELLVLARVQEVRLADGTLSVRYDRFGEPEPVEYALTGPEASLERARKHLSPP